MHPTKFDPCVGGGRPAGRADGPDERPGGEAQPKADPPMATPDRTGAISVTIGGQVRFQMKTKKRIREAFNENDRVVQVLADATDPTTLILIGRSAGTSRLEVTDVDGAKESYLIVVQRDVEMLRNLIRRTVPTALVEITPIGDSGNEHHPVRVRGHGGRPGHHPAAGRGPGPAGGGEHGHGRRRGERPARPARRDAGEGGPDAGPEPRGQLHHQREHGVGRQPARRAGLHPGDGRGGGDRGVAGGAPGPGRQPQSGSRAGVGGRTSSPGSPRARSSSCWPRSRARAWPSWWPPRPWWPGVGKRPTCWSAGRSR